MKTSQAKNVSLEQVEILDANGTVLEYADLKDGQWTVSLNGLAIGEHSFTARYREISSSARRLNVSAAEDVEDFKDASRGTLPARLVRPFYTLTWRKEGNYALPGVPTIDPNLSWPLVTTAGMDSAGGFETFYFTFTFNTVYTAIRPKINTSHTPGGAGVAIFRAFNENGNEIAYEGITDAGESEFTLASPGVLIKRLDVVLRSFLPVKTFTLGIGKLVMVR